MRISIFGLGYVGAVTAGCLAEQGHEVIGVDVQQQKVEDFNRGRPPIMEPSLDALVSQARKQGRLRATQSCSEAIAGSDVSLVSVGTPALPNGELDISHVETVTRQIAAELRAQNKEHALIYRSTMLPGSTERLVKEELADLEGNGRLQVLSYPEFLREGSAVADFRAPALTVVGTRNGAMIPVSLNGLIRAKASVVTWEMAEMVKYSTNAFHATKVAFANEIGRLSKQLGLNGQEVMEMLCQDTRLNLSASYLRPGNPFGGSCLPKDVQALSHLGDKIGLNLPLLKNLLPSNQEHLQGLLQAILRTGQKEAVIIGLSFKPKTDDLRGSAMVEVVQHLLAHGFRVRIFDPQVVMPRIVGINLRVVEAKIPRLESLLHQEMGPALGERGLVVVSQPCVDLTELKKWITPQHHLLDINHWPELRELPCSYEGFCW